MEGSWASAPGGGIVCGRAATLDAGWTNCATAVLVLELGAAQVSETGLAPVSGWGAEAPIRRPQPVHIVRATTISKGEKVDRLRALVTCCHHSESHPR